MLNASSVQKTLLKIPMIRHYVNAFKISSQSTEHACAKAANTMILYKVVWTCLIILLKTQTVQAGPVTLDSIRMEIHVLNANLSVLHAIQIRAA
jgi:hypothetical protein